MLIDAHFLKWYPEPHDRTSLDLFAHSHLESCIVASPVHVAGVIMWGLGAVARRCFKHRPSFTMPLARRRIHATMTLIWSPQGLPLWWQISRL